MSRKLDIIVLIVGAIPPISTAVFMLMVSSVKHIFEPQKYLNVIFGLAIMTLLGLNVFLLTYMQYRFNRLKAA